MGISKAMMERVFVAKSRTTDKTSICGTRYGNVMCSRGSVIPLFIEQIKAVQKAPACTIGTLALAVQELFHDKNQIHYIGIRHGEKKYETLLTKEECLHAYDMGNFFRVPADNRDLNYEQYFEQGLTEKAKLREFTSDNTRILNVEQVKEKLLSLEYVRQELET